MMRCSAVVSLRLVFFPWLTGYVCHTTEIYLADEQENILIALPILRTIPSSTIVAIIKDALTYTAASPSIERALEAIVSLPSPAPTYRVELKRGLGVEDATSVLEILTQWAEAWVLSNAKGLKWDIDQSQLNEEETSIPPLEAVSSQYFVSTKLTSRSSPIHPSSSIPIYRSSSLIRHHTHFSPGCKHL